MPDFARRYLAVDLGAESGRVILGEYTAGHLRTTEIRRFPNEPVEYANGLHWDMPRLWREIQSGLKAIGTDYIHGIAVDTWGVDYALLGERGELIGNPYHYRDKRTTGVMDEVFQIVPEEEIYRVTGIQFMPINTLYQLFAAQRNSPRLLASADRFLTVPDLLNYWLTGNAVCEWTNATTTQMADAQTRTWATDLLDRLGLPSHLPAPIIEPGSIIAPLLPCTSSQLAGTPVIAVASHDTGSAVAAIEAREHTAFLSSGTWSLLGIELDAPIINDTARALNFTNEGGVSGTTRFLKNVMGLWIAQGCRKSLAERGADYTYDALVQAAGQAPHFQALINPDAPGFLRPACMVSAVDRFCDATGQPRPASPGAYIRTVLESLALRYRIVLGQLEQLTGLIIRQIRVIGGGSRNDLLNQFTADATGRRVLAGPVEATALGNIAIQLLATGATSSVAESREIVARSHETRVFEPRDTTRWEQQQKRFDHYCEERFA